MYYKLNYDGKVERPKLFLRIPNKEGIGELKIGEMLNFELNTNDISLMNFNIYKTFDGKDTPFYDILSEGSLVEAQLLGVYWIVDVNEYGTGENTYKEIKAKSLEYELKRRKIFDISGVFAFYNVADTEKSLMHIITKELGNWTIGHIDNTLKTLYRTFDIDSSDAYSLLTDNISTSFECIFQFDTYNRVINAYTIDNFGKNTNIFLSYKNLVQQNILESSLDKVFTCFRVRGGDNLDIRAVNPTLDNKIYNFDWFMVPKSEGGKASNGLVAAWNSYQTLYTSLSATQTTNVNLLKTYDNDLLILHTKTPSSPTNDWTQYGLDELKGKEKTYINLQSVLLSNGAGSTSSSQHSEYTSTRNTLLAIQAEILVRNNQITAKNNQITSVNNNITNIANQLLLTNNFTSTQIKELKNFTFEDEYVDETYVVSDTDSEEEVIEVKQQLYNVSKTELARASQPQYNLETTLGNLFNLPEFKEYQEDFELGNIIKIRINKNLVATARLLSIKIDFSKPEDLSVVFANRNKLDSSTIDFVKVQSQASQTSNSVSIGMGGWDKAASMTNVVQQYMNSTFNAANQEVINSTDQLVTFGSYGMRFREKNELSGIYSPEEMWITKNKLLFSNDNFASSIAGIGKFTNPDTHETFYGFMGEAVVSNLVLSSALKIYNVSGTYTITDTTGFTATATSGANTYLVGINPNTPANIFRIMVNGSNKLYVDTVNNRLVIDGSLVAGSININNRFTVDSTGACTATALTLTGGSINIGNRFIVTAAGLVTINSNGLIVNSTNFTLTADGTLTCSNGNFTGTITSTNGTIGGWIIGSNSFTSNGNSTININNGSNKSMIIDYNGLTLYNKNTASAHYGDVTAVWDGSSAGGIMLSQGLNATHIAIGYNTSANTYNTAMLFSNNGFSSPIYGTVAAGFSFYRAVNISSTLKVNNNTVIHQGNYNSLGLVYPTSGSTHTHDTLDDNGYELNWAGNSCLFAWSGQDLGQSSYRWGGIYLSSAPNVSSDRNLKHDIETLPDIYKTIILKLRPVRFKYNDGSSDRFHTGFISQELEEVMDSLGVNSKDFAAFIKAPTYSVVDENGMYDTSSEITGYIYMLRHEELISPIVDLLQEQNNKIDHLENRINIIESKL